MGREDQIPPTAVETWRLRHPERGEIEVHIGADVRLRELDPGFPVEAENGSATAAEPEEAPDRILVRVAGEVFARLKDLRDQQVSLKPETPKALEAGAFSEPATLVGPPVLKVESNLLDSWVRSVVFKDSGQPAIDLDPPEGSRAARRLAAMAASPWKRVAFPLTAGLGKGGGALLGIILIPVLLGLLRPVVRWLRELLPDWEFTIPWPDWDIDIPWPEFDLPGIPWPDWRLPDIEPPGWVLFLLDYSKVWVPVLIGLVIGVIALRRHRRSREIKRRWEQELPPEEPESGR